MSECVSSVAENQPDVQAHRARWRVVLGVDPGPERSAYVLFDGDVLEKGILPNEELLDRLQNGADAWGRPILAIESMVSMGMACSQDVLDTQFWVGRFVQAFDGPFRCVTRRSVKIAMCGHMTASDSNIRQAVLDRFPKTGGGAIPQVGTLKRPGPLYGIGGTDLWSALAVALTFMEQERIRNLRLEELPDTGEWTKEEVRT